MDTADDARMSRKERRVLGAVLLGTIAFILGLVALYAWAMATVGS